MKLQIKRHWFTEKATVGLLVIDGQTFCFTLEDCARAEGIKVPGKTAIPAGEYRVIIDQSTRFKRPMPHILDVPKFEGVRIHAGNTTEHTEGCPLLGYQRVGETIYESKKAFDDFYIKLDTAIMKGEQVTLTITNEQL